MSDFPVDSIQSMTDVWWEEDPSKTICRGALVWTYVQFYSQIPYELYAERIEAEKHDTAVLQARPLHADGRRSESATLPVAGLPLLAGADCFITNRAKKRPGLVLGAVDHKVIEKKWAKSISSAMKHDFFLVAPYFSIEQKARGGCPPEFAERIMHAEYSRFFWDFLPGRYGHESLLRFDQIQPVGFHHQAYDPFGFRLSKAALKLVDEWVDWLIYDRAGEDLRAFRELVQGE